MRERVEGERIDDDEADSKADHFKGEGQMITGQEIFRPGLARTFPPDTINQCHLSRTQQR